MLRRTFLAMSGFGLLAGCALGGVNQSSDPRPVMTRSYDLRQFSFTAQEGLNVSEATNFYPSADVVWRGDPMGPRIPQIATMFEAAAERNKAVLNGDVPVIVDIQLIRFHGVTELTRATVGGVYNIIFLLTVRDTRTGTIIEGPRRVVGNLDAPGGSGAVALDQAGQTQRVRVTDFLTGLLRQQLS